MKKVISYSLFKDINAKPENDFEFDFYLRIFVFNVRMAKLVYPDWEVHVYVSLPTYYYIEEIFEFLSYKYNISLFTEDYHHPLCKAMLWRLKPIFENEVDIVLCRDADALLSYREAQLTQEWLSTDKKIFSIKDNPAHSLEMMGGLVGFRAKEFRDRYQSWNNLLSLAKNQTWERGQDQSFMMQVIYPEYKNEIFRVDATNKNQNHALLKGVNPNLWVSNLCSFFIGSAGVNEMETIRFFRDFAPDKELDEVCKQYPKIFYWL